MPRVCRAEGGQASDQSRKPPDAQAKEPPAARPIPRSLARRARPDPVPHRASRDVVVDKPARLHERIGRGRPDETKPRRLRELRERAVEAGVEAGVSPRAAAVRRAFGAKRPHQSAKETPSRSSDSAARALLIVASIFARFRTIAASASSRNIPPPKRRSPTIEPGEGGPEALPLTQDREPREAGLERLEAEALERSRRRPRWAAPTPRRGSGRSPGRRCPTHSA